MFSGLVEEVGKILSVSQTGDGRRLKIGASGIACELKLGDSVAVSGTCLTVVNLGLGWFEVEATLHTLRMTSLGSLGVSQGVNLERALQLKDRLGGHLVTGHVDGLAKVVAIEQDGFSKIVTFAATKEVSKFFVDKGSVTIDGVSLTVAKVDDEAKENLDGKVSTNAIFSFSVALIPHTMEVTTLGRLKVGDMVNFEADIIAKYVARLMGPLIPAKINKPGLSLAVLSEHGYT